jgi:hypothetical protein
MRDARRDRHRRRAAVVIRARLCRLHKIAAACLDGNPDTAGPIGVPDPRRPGGPTTTLMSGPFQPMSGVIVGGGDTDVATSAAS